MQPTFFPWIGYFAMIDRSDTFVFFDSVQFAKRSWQQRNKIKTPNGVAWLSCPVKTKGKFDQKISEAEILEPDDYFKKLCKTITSNYSKSPYFDKYAFELFEVTRKNNGRLCEFNISIILWLCKKFGITDTVFSRSSALKSTGTKDQLLTNICIELGFSTYLSAPGSKGYIEASEHFDKNCIDVVYHEYTPYPYAQINGDFLPYMSAIDLLFNLGPDSHEIINKGQLQL